MFGILIQSKGYISINTKKKKGVVFEILFPKTYEEIENKELFTETKKISNNTANILIAEDNNSLRGLISRILKKEGYKILLARVHVHTKLRRMNLELKQKNNLLAKREVQLNHLVEERTYQLKEQLHTNSLTSLPNRLSLLNDIRASEKPILILLNIDSFKEINSFYGHLIGDDLLVELSKGFGSMWDKEPV